MDKLGLGLVLVYMGIVGAIIWGWIVNVITLLNMPFVFSAELVLRLIGIFIAPLGGVMGYL